MPALMRSELPELARTRQHWIVMARRPHPFAVAALAALVVWALFAHAVAVVVVLVLLAGAAVRWQTWRAELIILTTRRIVRLRGVPETTTSEASLRLDRVSGARLVQSVPGKLLGYGTIELEAPGDHPDVRRLVTIARPHEFYAQLRQVVFGEIPLRPGLDPEDGPPPGQVLDADATGWWTGDEPYGDHYGADSYGADPYAADPYGRPVPGPAPERPTDRLPQLPRPSAASQRRARPQRWPGGRGRWRRGR